MKITLTRGVSGSGKSHWALEQARIGKGKIARVNKDEVRSQCFGGFWSRENESAVKLIEEAMVIEALACGRDVIIDSTNIGGGHEERFHKLSREHGATVVVKDFKADFKTCVERDSKRQFPVGKGTIKKQWKALYGSDPEEVKWTQLPHRHGYEKVVVCDIDGTLANHSGLRSPYDWSKVSSDVPHEDVISILNALMTFYSCKVVFVSGRDASCEEQTRKWLSEFVTWCHVPVTLHMRQIGDKRSDTEVKKEIFKNLIHPMFDVICVLDDRDRVVKMWREQGLRVLQVAEGSF
jgi:predicted kinase